MSSSSPFSFSSPSEGTHTRGFYTIRIIIIFLLLHVVVVVTFVFVVFSHVIRSMVLLLGLRGEPRRRETSPRLLEAVRPPTLLTLSLHVVRLPPPLLHRFFPRVL